MHHKRVQNLDRFKVIIEQALTEYFPDHPPEILVVVAFAVAGVAAAGGLNSRDDESVQKLIDTAIEATKDIDKQVMAVIDITRRQQFESLTQPIFN